MYKLAPVLLLLFSCVRPSPGWKLYGRDKVLCVAGNDLAQKYAEDLIPLCQDLNTSERVVFFVASEGDFEVLSKRWGWQEVTGYARFSPQIPGWIVGLNEVLWERNAWEGGVRHELCHTQGLSHKPGEPFGLPGRCGD